MKIFIDGDVGTTGLQLKKQLDLLDNQLIDLSNGLKLNSIKKLEYITLDEQDRKNINAREDALNKADVVFLCLPDEVAIEAVSLIENKNTIVIDSSTAHRTNSNWAYGFPELSPEFEKKIINSKRISVPGCHASGFNAIVYPLIKDGILKTNSHISAYSLTGYSGGGKAMIKEFEEGKVSSRGAKPNMHPVNVLNDSRTGSQIFSRMANTPTNIGAFPYSLELKHKHLKEMISICGFENPPIFQPIVVDVKQGMLVSVPIFESVDIVYETLRKAYGGSGVDVGDDEKNNISRNIKVLKVDNSDRISMTDCNGTNKMNVLVYGNAKQTIATAQFDNLGKGASGAAVQCFLLSTGIEKQV